ncbi:MAG: DUF541 domain-containing protein [Betaproteobacteria bacterium]|nr:DUF541 domain-containing protein [Betaproteobacteria bacterium]
MLRQGSFPTSGFDMSRLFTVLNARSRMRAATCALAAFFLFLGVSWSSHGVAAEPDRAPYIEVTGEAEVRVSPDTAQLAFGVTTRADNAAAAAQQNATRMEAVLDAVRKALGSGAQIGTGTYSLRAEHSSPRDGTPARVTGYTASNIVRLETRELDRLGELIDVATQAGANQVQRIGFTLSDPAAARRGALRDAVADAQAEAEAIAAALGTTLGPVQSVVEQEMGPIRPFMQDAVMARAEAAATPIEPGMVSVRSRVLVRIQIAR